MPVDRRARVRASRKREQRLAPFLGVQTAESLLIGAVLGVEPRPAIAVEQIADDADDARRVEDVHGRLAVLGRDPHGRVLTRGRRAADEERQVDPAPLHLLRDVRPSRRATA